MTRRRSTSLLASAVPAALLAALLVGCGDDPGTTAADPREDASAPSGTTGTPTSDSSGARGPACEDVWRAGETLPPRYEGCDHGGSWMPADGRYCEFGKPLVTHDRFYAVPGGRIAEASRELLKDRGYRDVLRKCSG